MGVVCTVCASLFCSCIFGSIDAVWSLLFELLIAFCIDRNVQMNDKLVMVANMTNKFEIWSAAPLLPLPLLPLGIEPDNVAPLPGKRFRRACCGVRGEPPWDDMLCNEYRIPEDLSPHVIVVGRYGSCTRYGRMRVYKII